MPEHPGQRQPVPRHGAVRGVVAAVEGRVAQDRLAGDLRDRDVLVGQPRARAQDHRDAQLTRMRERPLERLHPAERAADRGQRAGDPQVGQQLALELDEVADGRQREAQPVRPPGGRIDELGPVVPLQPPSRFEDTTW